MPVLERGSTGYVVRWGWPGPVQRGTRSPLTDDPPPSAARSVAVTRGVLPTHPHSRQARRHAAPPPPPPPPCSVPQRPPRGCVWPPPGALPPPPRGGGGPRGRQTPPPPPSAANGGCWCAQKKGGKKVGGEKTARTTAGHSPDTPARPCPPRCVPLAKQLASPFKHSPPPQQSASSRPHPGRVWARKRAWGGGAAAAQWVQDRVP